MNTALVAQNRTRIDSLQKNFKRESNEIKKAEILLALSNEYIHCNIKAINYAYTANKIAQEQKDPQLLSKSLISIAKAKYLLQDNFTEANSNFKESEKVCINNNLYDLQVQTLIEWSILEQSYNHYLASLEKLHTAYSICTKNHDKTKQSEIAYQIANLYLQNHKYSDAIAWGSICDSISQSTKNVSSIGSTHKLKALINKSTNNYNGVYTEYHKMIELYKQKLNLEESNRHLQTMYANSLIDYATTLRDINQYDSSILYINQCLKFIRLKFGKDTLKFEPQHLMVRVYLEHTITLSAKDIFLETKQSKDAMMDYLNKVKDTLTLSNVYFEAANYFFYANSPTRAISYLKNFIHITSRFSNPLKVVEGLNLHGLSNMQIGNYKFAIGCFKSGLSLCKKNKFIAKQLDFHTCLANIYHFTDKPDSTIFHAKYVLKTIDKDVDSLLFYANCYFIASAYIMKSDYQNAQPYINELITLSKTFNKPIQTKYGIVASDFIIANYYRHVGNYPLFVAYMDKSIQKAQKEGVDEIERDNYLTLAKYYKAIRKHEKAYEYLEKYEAIKDKIINLYTQRLLTLNELSDENSSRKKENLLLKRERELQDAKIRNNRIIILFIILIAAILLVLSGMLILSNRRKNRLNQLLEIQTKEILEKNRLLEKQTLAIEQSEAMIKNQNIKLVNLNKTKDKFFSIIAHDLRNPFSGLLGLTNYMVDNLESMQFDETKKYIVSINESSRQTFILLENLLDWSQTQLGSIKYNPEVFNLFFVAENTKKLFNSTSTIKEITIINRIESEVWVFADKKMVETVIRNLVGNALKFTNRNGAVEISSINIDSNVQVAVRDTGIGMDEDQLNKLFTLESANSHRGTANEKGTGIGLIVCEELIKKHDQRIWAESIPNEGSTFFFTLKSMA